MSRYFFDEDGGKVFDASYDAWGRQTVTLNTINLRRGYCGHEMLPEYGLIDMRGRVYAPAVGRFLSCDNYVQEPDNSQNFNRYSYCLNNPLRYTDPTGELFGIDDAIIAFTAFNVASSMMSAAFNGQSVWKAGALSLISSAASYGIGQAFGSLGSFWGEAARAGAHGIATGITTSLSGGNFFGGFTSGAMASGIGSFAQSVHMPTGLMIGCTTVMGGLTSWAGGGDFRTGAIQGMMIGILNHAQHDIRYSQDTHGNWQGELPEIEVVGHRRYYLSLSTKTGLLGIAFECSYYYWNNMKTSTKSRIVYNAKRIARNHGYKISTPNRDIYRKLIPNGLNKVSKNLGITSAGINIIENITNANETGRIGVGNVFDMTMSGISLTGWGTPISLGYIGADFLYLQYSGMSIRESLNNIYSIKTSDLQTLHFK